MKVRRYIAESVGEAMAQVKAELGNEAIILHSRTIRQGGFLGLFGKKMIEVTAALEDEVMPRPQAAPLPQNPPNRRREAQSAYRNTGMRTPEPSVREVRTPQRNLPISGAGISPGAGSSMNPSARYAPPEEEPYNPQHLSDFLDRFRDHLDAEEVVSPRTTAGQNRPAVGTGNTRVIEAPLVEGTTVLRSDVQPMDRSADRLGVHAGEHALDVRATEPGASQPREAEPSSEQLAEIRKELQQTQVLLRQVVEQRDEEKSGLANELPRYARRLWKQLVSNEMNEDLATELINGVLAECQAENEQELEELVHQKVLEHMRSVCVAEIKAPRPEIIALVGPTGVGKTTTLAKLAANKALVEKKKVGLITIDTYRIAAVEQLKTYAKILDLQVHVVFTPQELPRVLALMPDCDIIFIDTAGRSHKNAMQMSELKAFFDAGRPTSSFLVLSLTTKFSDMMEIIAQYEPLHLETIIFTKLDVSCIFAGIFLFILHKFSM